MSTAYKSWDAKGSAALKLNKKFALYKSTNGVARVNYKLNKPKDILNEVYKTQPYLAHYNPTYFLGNNFCNLHNNWLTAQEKDEPRKPDTGRRADKQNAGTFFPVSTSSFLLKFIALISK